MYIVQYTSLTSTTLLVKKQMEAALHMNQKLLQLHCNLNSLLYLLEVVLKENTVATF